MSRAGRGVVLLVAAGTAACQKTRPVDPAVEAYHAAVLRFAETSKLTQDLTYRDPRFDPVLDALDHIPLGSEPKEEAQALADRIRSARALANSQQPNSDRLQAEAVASPVFEPILKLPPASAGTAAPASEEAAAAIPVGGEAPGGGIVSQDHARHLPSWYAGYFGTPPASGDDAGAATGDDAPESPAPEATVHRKAAAKPADANAPPAVFGVPGPAGSALQGRPGE